MHGIAPTRARCPRPSVRTLRRATYSHMRDRRQSAAVGTAPPLVSPVALEHDEFSLRARKLRNDCLKYAENESEYGNRRRVNCEVRWQACCDATIRRIPAAWRCAGGADRPDLAAHPAATCSM